MVSCKEGQQCSLAEPFLQIYFHASIQRHTHTKMHTGMQRYIHALRTRFHQRHIYTIFCTYSSQYAFQQTYDSLNLCHTCTSICLPFFLLSLSLFVCVCHLSIYLSGRKEGFGNPGSTTSRLCGDPLHPSLLLLQPLRSKGHQMSNGQCASVCSIAAAVIGLVGLLDRACAPGEALRGQFDLGHEARAASGRRERPGFRVTTSSWSILAQHPVPMLFPSSACG